MARTSKNIRPERTAGEDQTVHSEADFRAYDGRGWRHYKELVSVCVAHAEPGPILDLGAGLGFFVEACRRYGLPCIGLEGSRYAVDIALERYPMEIRHHRLSEPLPFESDTFSVVMCNQTIEHLRPDVARFVLCESYRVLAKGGLLAVYSPCRHNPEQAADPTHINLYDPSRLTREVLAAGFRDYRAVDSPRRLLGASEPARLLMTALHRFTHWGFLSASANCLAYKPRACAQ